MEYTFSTEFLEIITRVAEKLEMTEERVVVSGVSRNFMHVGKKVLSLLQTAGTNLLEN